MSVESERRVAVPLSLAVLATLVAACGAASADLNKAERANTIAAYDAFLAKHPEGTESDYVRRRRQRLVLEHDWKLAREVDSAEVYEAFLKEHGFSDDRQMATEALTRLRTLGPERDRRNRDEAMFAAVAARPTLEAIEEYLRANSPPRHAEAALVLARALLDADPRVALVKQRLAGTVRGKARRDAATPIHVVWILETSREDYAAYRDRQGRTRLIDAEGSALEGGTVAELILERFPAPAAAVLVVNPRDLRLPSARSRSYGALLQHLDAAVGASHELDRRRTFLSFLRLDEPATGARPLDEGTADAARVCSWIAPVDASLRDATSSDPGRRDLALRCLGVLGSKDAIPVLARTLTADDPALRTIAARSILDVQGADGFPGLSAGGEEALDVLLEHVADLPTPARDDFLAKGAEATVRPFGAAAVPGLVALLAKADSRTTTDALVKLLQEFDPELVLAATEPHLLTDGGVTAARAVSAERAMKAAMPFQAKYWLTTGDRAYLDPRWPELGPLVYELAEGGRSPHVRFIFRRLMELGREDSIPELTKLIAGCDDVAAVRLFLNCGNAELEAAAKRWAGAHGYEVRRTWAGSGPRPTWRSR